MDNTIKLGVLGLGGRGAGLLTGAILPACQDYGMEVSAVFDLYEDRTIQGADIIEKATGKRPRTCTSQDEIMHDPEIKAVLITSSWESHIELAIQAMRAGKWAAFEVGGAYTLEDCWRLVNTFEETGVPCMMLENCCYGERELMTLHLYRQGMLGDVVHCEGGYHHDLREEIVSGYEKRHYRLRNYLNRNCENYPTHELGPIAKILDINNGNRLVSLSSFSSCSKGLNAYAAANKGEDHPLAKANFAQGDVVTTVVKTAKGQTITLALDTTLPRAYSRGFTVRGTKAAYFEDMDALYIDGEHQEFEGSPRKLWGNVRNTYAKQYAHPLWENYDPKGGHGGMDYLVFSAFMEALKLGKKPPIDVYDAATYMCISALSEESIHLGGAPVAIPDFTRGKWYMRDDIDFDLKFNLDRSDVNGGLY